MYSSGYPRPRKKNCAMHAYQDGRQPRCPANEWRYRQNKKRSRRCPAHSPAWRVSIFIILPAVQRSPPSRGNESHDQISSIELRRHSICFFLPPRFIEPAKVTTTGFSASQTPEVESFRDPLSSLRSLRLKKGRVLSRKGFGAPHATCAATFLIANSPTLFSHTRQSWILLPPRLHVHLRH